MEVVADDGDAIIALAAPETCVHIPVPTMGTAFETEVEESQIFLLGI